MQQLLASARAVLMTRTDPGSLSYEAKARIDRVHVELTATACKVIRGVEGWASSSAGTTAAAGAVDDRQRYRSCFTTCVALLTSLFMSAESTVGGQRSFILKLHSVMTDLDVVRSIVFHAGLASTPPAPVAIASSVNATPSVATTLDEAELALVHSVFELFTGIAAGGDASMLTLLLEGQASLVFTRSTIFASWQSTRADADTGTFPLRGYVRAGVQGHRQREKTVTGTASMNADDPTHVVWRAGLKFIAATLRSSSRNTDARDETMAHYCTIAFDFLMSNREVLLASMRQCSSVISENDDSKRHPKFTLNALLEATLIMSVVSELTSRFVVDQFQRGCPELYSALVAEAKSLVVSISSFLGASGSSRELFRAMADYETADTIPGDQNSQYLAFSSVYQFMSSGVSSAKHEAILYSHFVTRCSSAVTREDRESQSEFPPRWERTPRDGSTEDPRSMSSLEDTSRSSVTSKFAFQLEQIASECLFSALSIVWKTHPSATSFVMFSEEEASRLEAMALVRQGMIIAFRTSSSGGVLVADDSSSPEQRPVYFGQVLHCDTVHRVWNVRMMASASGMGGDTCFVRDFELAGVEDANKRRCTLKFCPAPETCSDLEAMGRSLSVGHLLLVLRWCNQFTSEERGGSTTSRLAELAAAFVGTELSLHHEAGNRHGIMKLDAEKMLSAQLLDLFGENPEFGFEYEDAYGDPPVRREGRLKNVVCGSVWQAVRKQLGNELEKASNDIQAKGRGNASRTTESGWYSGNQSVSDTSSFLGLGR